MSKIYFKVYRYLNYCFRLFLWSFDFLLMKIRFITSELLTDWITWINWITYTLVYELASNSCSLTAWNMPKYGLSLIRIFPYVGRIISDFSHNPKYEKIWIRLFPYTRKYMSEKAYISAYFTQCPAEHFQS